MAYRCELCDKKSSRGRQHTHHTGVAGGQWKKRAQTTLRGFKPNLHWIRLPMDGILRRMYTCTKCIKRMKFDQAKLSPSVAT